MRFLFRPMNPYAWAYFGPRGKAVMLVYHARFLPTRVKWWVAVYRVNRTPGPRWSYR